MHTGSLQVAWGSHMAQRWGPYKDCPQDTSFRTNMRGLGSEFGGSVAVIPDDSDSVPSTALQEVAWVGGWQGPRTPWEAKAQPQGVSTRLSPAQTPGVARPAHWPPCGAIRTHAPPQETAARRRQPSDTVIRYIEGAPLRSAQGS